MRIARAVLEGLRLALARDHLGEDPAPAREHPPKPGLLHVLFVSREPLGFEPEEPAPRRRGRLAALFAFEKLDDSP